MTVITSAANPLVKRIRKLRDRRERWSQRAFVVEGVQPVWRAHEAGADIETLVVAPDLVAGLADLRTALQVPEDFPPEVNAAAGARCAAASGNARAAEVGSSQWEV